MYVLVNKLHKAQWWRFLIPKLNHSSSSAYKVLAKVPLRPHSHALIKVPVHRMGIFTSYFDFGKDREIHIVFVFDKSSNATVSQRLLFAKLVAGECKDTEIFLKEFGLQLNQLFVMLICVATLTGNINNKQDLVDWVQNTEVQCMVNQNSYMTCLLQVVENDPSNSNTVSQTFCQISWVNSDSLAYIFLDYSQPSILSYFYSIFEHVDSIVRELDPSAKWKTWLGRVFGTEINKGAVHIFGKKLIPYFFQNGKFPLVKRRQECH